MIDTLYAAAARRRRERYATRPDLRRRLRRPVISVGNLAVGGRGKTPVAAAIARMLLEAGERPAILSRGYGRTERVPGVVVVRDPERIRGDVARSGDEPFMLARQLPGASVVVSEDRYAAGRLAEHHLGATVHILDDGFQHFQLDRDLDILLLGAEDVQGGRTLPLGRLREPLDCAIAADVVLTTEDVVFESVPEIPVFRVHPQSMAPYADMLVPVFAVAGIAHPERFVRSLQGAGFNVCGSRTFGDHHRYSGRDLRQIYGEAKAAGAYMILTTEKDFVRLLPFRPFELPILDVPYEIAIRDEAVFRQWLLRGVRDARDELDG